MSDVEVVDLEQYFEEFADSTAMAEAAAFKTVPTGKYVAQISKQTGQKWPDEDRPTVRVKADLTNEGGVKVGSTFFNLAWIPKRNAEGKLDKPFQLWEQLTRALYPGEKADDRSKKPVGQVLGDAMKYPITLYLTESVQDQSGKWSTPQDIEGVKAAREAGLKVTNFVQSISKVD